jgi:pretoxin HINT domain-containing protein
VPKAGEGQKLAVRLLGQIDSPGASRALAMLALMSTVAEVRQEATQILRRRDPRDFAPLLVELIRDPIKYEVKAVKGPGSPGELLIKSKDANIKRIYSPLTAPNIPLLPTDFVTTDAAGLPVIARNFSRDRTPSVEVSSLADAASVFGWSTINPNQVTSLLTQAGLSPNQAQKLGPAVAQNLPRVQYMGGQANQPLRATGLYNQELDIPVGQMMLDAQRSAQVAQQQLAGDIQTIDAYNAPIQQTNRLARQVLSDALGTDLGEDSLAWQKWMADLFGYAFVASTNSAYETPTIVEQVPLAYQPQSSGPAIVNQLIGVQVIRSHACFAAGTPVRTLDGPRPIEDLRAGDEVLTQNPESGELRYQPLVAVYHNPPNATFRIELDGESIVATGIHRLWKAGKGWTMVRELKPGEILRTLGGTAAVKSVVEEKVQPVFNLRVADGESFFVGRSGVLAHDNSTINPTPEPFDAVFQLGESTAAKTPAPGR